MQANYIDYKIVSENLFISMKVRIKHGGSLLYLVVTQK